MTPSVRRRILRLIRGGNVSATAAAACGVFEDAFHQRMRTDDGFRRAVVQAEAAFEEEMLAIIRKAAGDGDVGAEAWMRAHPSAVLQ